MSTTPPVPLPPPAPPQIPQQDQSQQAPVQSSPVNGQPSPAQQQLAHSALIGHGFKALVSSMAGSTTQYQNTPNGPQPVEVPNKPGQFFRNILAGAIMGGVAGGESSQNNAGSGWAAAARGAGAAQQGFQQQQQAREAESQKEFQNQLTANKENREQQGFVTEQKVRQAQIAQANAETLHTNVLTQGSNLTQHQDVVNADKDRISTFANAGVRPTFENIPESEMTDIIKNSPGASTLDWRHTGVKLGVDANGQPTYEYTLSAYDPKASAPLSAATIKQWDDDGLFKYHPEYKAFATAGRPVSVAQFTAMDQQAQNLFNQGIVKQTKALDLKKDQAAINKDNAQTAEAYTSVAKNREQLKEAQLGKTAAEQFNNALSDLNKVGGDFSKLEPSSKVVIAESANKMVPALTQEYKDILADPTDPDAQKKAGEVLQQIQSLTKLGAQALTSSTTPAGAAGVGTPLPAPVTFTNPQGQQVLAKTQEDVDKMTKLGYKKVEPPKPISLSGLGKETVGNIKAVAPVIGTVLNAIP